MERKSSEPDGGEDYSDPDVLLTSIGQTIQETQQTARQTIELRNSTKRDEFLLGRQAISEKIREAHDELDVEASIVQKMYDVLQTHYNSCQMAGFMIGIVSTIYQIVADTTILSATPFNATVLEKGLIVLPPTFMTAAVTALIGIQRQIRLTERLEELTTVKRDADYLVSKLEPMVENVNEVETTEELDAINMEFKGEPSALKQKSKRALDKVLKKEDRMVHAHTYRFFKLKSVDMVRRYKGLIRLMRHGEAEGVSSESITQQIEEFGNEYTGDDLV